MKLVAATLLYLLFVGPAVQAQVVARQGDPQESPLQEFKSPMILDLPLKDFPVLPETTPFKAELRLAAEEVDRLFAEGEPAVLRVTMAVTDNS